MRTGEVPGYNLTDNAKWFADGVCNLVLGGLDSLAMNFVGKACVIAKDGDGAANISVLSPAECLADVEGLQSCDLVLALLDEVCKLVKEPAALVSGGVQAPCGLECLLSSLDGEVNVFGSALGYLSKDFARGWVDNTERRRKQ